MLELKDKIIKSATATYSLYHDGIKLFNRRKCLMLASSSSFYLILAAIPFFLLVIRLVGFFLGDLAQVHTLIFKIGENLFPDVAPEVLIKIRDIIKVPLFGRSEFTTVNFILLLASSLSFLNAIWSGIYVVTEDISSLGWWKHLKGIGIIALSVLVVIISLSFHPVLLMMTKFLQHNALIDLIYESLEGARGLIDYLRTLDISKSIILKENFFHFAMFVAYFSIIYRWLFNWKISLKRSVIMSSSFVFLLLLGKSVFWIYFFYMRNTLITNYGDYYSAIVALVWVYLVMIFFFFGVCLGAVSKKYNVS